jgi:pyrrolidone-carboxylate peptidase
MNILIYGFKPYKEHEHNITESIVKRLKKKNITKVIFPARFDKKLFLKRIKTAKPDVIIGLGQHPRTRKIRQERKAVNLYRKSKKEKPRKITKGPKHYFSTLIFPKKKQILTSYNAGMYVCNFSMYTILDNTDLPFAFFHIPKDYNVSKAVKYLESIMKE